ncbi:hypothetical protein [Shewanella sp. CG12_big_fil_rev_8_21_14_0_65_47_15]|uniref:hypothetical protein n=1 Tax=Shewanella sp. CG12_big_fil_rev_8_21_14_0_65_47_15 TaxID=1975537 RepID=UPI000CB5E325|nr:hypothetical protein [Shewanella sp. CG12_big_fil_rev_8_21_14_0_65_47_15]PIW63130.1 MAG: hypothetical protein COW15_01135 [Shewanella sp. CG12_big_fil_rev_8_21_14_0_65_47_15]
MTQSLLNGLSLNRLLALGLLSITWTLLLWLNFSIAPNAFAHFVAIPVLFMATGISALLITSKHRPKRAIKNPS